MVHLLLLGWATTIVMGASMQIVQVVLCTSLYSRPLGYVQLALHSLGVLGLLFGFYKGAWLIAAGGGLVGAGALLYALNVALTFVRKREWNPFVFGIGLSLLALLAAIGLGVVMGLEFARGGNADRHETVFASHLWLGLAGWLAGSVLIYSFKLLPMFYVSRKKASRSAYWIVGGFHVGVWLQALAPWCGWRGAAAAGTVCLLGSLGWFTVHAFAVRRLSSGKQPVGAVRIAFALIPVHYGLLLIWCGWRLFGGGPDRLPEAWLASLILGWFTPTIWSYLAKILPFLWWGYRFRSKDRRKDAVALSRMLPERRMTWELGGYLAGVAAVVFGLLTGLPAAATLGLAVAIGSIAVYACELLRVFRY